MSRRRPNGFPRKALNVEVAPETYSKLNDLAGDWGVGELLDVALKNPDIEQKLVETFKTFHP